MDAFGKSIEIKKIKSAKLINLSNNKETNVIGNIQMQDEGKKLVAVFDKVLEMEWASYALHTEIQTSFGSTTHNVHKFTIKTKIFEKVVVNFAQTASAEVVEDYQYDEFPA